MRIFLSFLFALLSSALFSMHIVGGYMTYKPSGSEWTIDMVLYRDCAGGGAPFDEQAYFSVYRKEGTDWVAVSDQFVALNSSERIVQIPSCGFFYPCIEKGLYSFDLALPDDGFDYRIAYQRCCYAVTLANLVNSGDQGMTMFVELSAAARLAKNTAPVKNGDEAFWACTHIDNVLDFSFVDADGDDLDIRFCPPLAGGGPSLIAPQINGCEGAQPTTFCPPPYDELDFLVGYSPEKPFGESTPTDINAQASTCTVRPTALGTFLFGLCVEEYRNGVLFGSTSFVSTFYVGDMVGTEALYDPTFQLYPNPAQNEIFIKTNENGVKTSGNLLFSNVLGQIYDFGTKNLNLNARIDLQDLPRGMYQVFLQNNVEQVMLGQVLKE